MITLSPMTLRDVPFFNAVRNECAEWLHDPRTHTLQEAAFWFRDAQPAYLLVLLDGLPIGYCRVNSGEGSNELTVGMDIHKDFRGYGHALDAYRALFLYLRHGFGVSRFRLLVLKKNIRAKRLYDYLGFVVTRETEIDYEMVWEFK